MPSAVIVSVSCGGPFLWRRLLVERYCAGVEVEKGSSDINTQRTNRDRATWRTRVLGVQMEAYGPGRHGLSHAGTHTPWS